VSLDPRGFEVEASGLTLRGEEVGEGPPILLLHGLTATRRYVVHGSRLLPRRGYRVISYDARGHGESDPPPGGAGYSYAELATDVGPVIGRAAGERRVVLAGHSMGAHTAVAFALREPEQLAALVVIGPVYPGFLDEEVVGGWDRLADGLERDGVDGFLQELERQGIDPRWRDTVVRFTRARMEAHRHLDAVADALREVPRSQPFGSMDELEFLEVPALVVASRDVADPGHPFAVAEAYAERLPRSRLVSEEEGKSPLAWQGGRLSRAIASFCAEPAVSGRLRAAA
jgi:pimeloyl-ACP methyl ester carboxylesterase